MKNSNYLWQANQDLSTACLQHPFVRGIAGGSLPQNSFAYYVGQDAFFLGAFARAYSIAAAKAPDWEGFEIFHNLGSPKSFVKFFTPPQPSPYQGEGVRNLQIIYDRFVQDAACRRQIVNLKPVL
jgi:hypothetical protein